MGDNFENVLDEMRGREGKFAAVRQSKIESGEVDGEDGMTEIQRREEGQRLLEKRASDRQIRQQLKKRASDAALAETAAEIEVAAAFTEAASHGPHSGCEKDPPGAEDLL